MGKFADRDDGDEMFPFQRLAARGALPFKAMGKFADRDDGDEMFPFQRLAARGALPWKAREVWQNLIAQLPTDDEVPKLRGHRVVVVGAGLCGLRAALCLATQ